MPVQHQIERLLRHLPLLVAAVTSAVLLIAVWDLETSQQKLTDISSARLIETEQLRAKEVSRAIKDLRNSAATLASAVEIENYFTNLDLGMSWQYGLGASLEFTRTLFVQTVAKAPKSGALPIDQISLFDERGQLIVSSSTETSVMLLPPQMSGSGIMVDFEQGVIEVAETVFIRGRERGTVIAALELDQLATILGPTKEDGELSFLIFENDKFIQVATGEQVNDTALQSVLTLVPKKGASITPELAQNGPFSEFFALHIPVPGVPLSLLVLKPKSQAPFLWKPNYSGVILAILAVVILAATITVLRMGFRAQRLKHAYETTERHRTILHLKNQELSDEILRREHAEARLRSNQSELRMVSQVALKSHDSVVITDTNRKVVWTNEAFERLFGQGSDGSQQQDIRSFFALDDTDLTSDNPLTDHTVSQDGFRGVTEITILNGPQVAMDVTLFPIMDESGAKEFLVYIGRDVTEERKAAKAMGRAREAAEQGERTKAEFLANMSHEIRTPLGGVIGMADLLVETNLDKEQRGFADTIRGSSTSLLAIINDILDLSKLDAGKMVFHPVDFSPVDCFTETLDLLAPMAEAKGLSLTLSVADSTPAMVRADDGRIRQVATNIIGNAIKFTDAGKVAVHLSGADVDGATGLRFEVSDTGVGIAKEKLATIFDHFVQAETSTTRRFGGSGLGLSICRHIVDALGGAIDVSSRIGEGTVFSATIPVGVVSEIAPSRHQQDQTSEDVSTLEPGLSVLIAEDNQTNQLVLSNFLKSQPIEVAFANDGVDAVEAAAAGTYDLIFMDMSMPRLNGVEATKKIRGLSINQPTIVALTAHALDAERETCLNAGMDGFLTKPIRKKDFLNWIAGFQKSQSDASKAGKTIR